MAQRAGIHLDTRRLWGRATALPLVFLEWPPELLASNRRAVRRLDRPHHKSLARWLGAVASNVSLELAGDAGPLGGFAKSASALAAWNPFFPPRLWAPTARSLKSCRGGPRTPGLPDARAALRLSSSVGTELRGSVVLPRRTEG